MKKLVALGFLAVLPLFFSKVAVAAPIQTYFSLGALDGSIEDAQAKVKDALQAGDFEVIGDYSPAGDASLRSIVYTRGDMQQALLKLEPTRMLAAALKVGLQKDGDKVKVSITNPEFIFRAYTQKEFGTAEGELMKAHKDVLAAFGHDKGFGAPIPFGGGDLDSDKLYKYHYMFGMEYFEDMVTLNKKAKSFDEQVAVIEKNLDAAVGGAKKVYAIKPEGKKIAVYGVALTNAQEGESHFLPIIGVDHVAAMPYEIIVVDNKVFMLHGRYRIALHWPALTMGTFGKIMSTPGDIEDQMRAVTR